jgi:hypothetical protein
MWVVSSRPLKKRESMITDEVGRRLHDRATRGESLTPEEHVSLEAWYARHDAEEMALLAAAPLPPDTAAMRERITTLLAQLVNVTRRVHALAVENERLYREITILREQPAREQDLDIREAYPLMDAVARAEGWDDPDMDSYNIYARKPRQ